MTEAIADALEYSLHARRSFVSIKTDELTRLGLIGAGDSVPLTKAILSFAFE